MNIGLSTHPGTGVDGASGRSENLQISFLNMFNSLRCYSKAIVNKANLRDLKAATGL